MKNKNLDKVSGGAISFGGDVGVSGDVALKDNSKTSRIDTSQTFQKDTQKNIEVKSDTKIGVDVKSRVI